MIDQLKRMAYKFARTEDAVEEIAARAALKHLESGYADIVPKRSYQLLLDAAAEYFADSLPLSGISPTAHRTATRALQANDNDPFLAYQNQTGTSRVSLHVMNVVAGSTYLPDAPPEPIPYTHTDLSDTIQHAIDNLTDIQREAIELVYVGGLTTDQARTILGVSKNVLDNRLKSAKTRLRKFLTNKER